MKSWLMAPLMAATILGSVIPSIAQAQDGERRGGGWNRGGGEARAAPAMPRGGDTRSTQGRGNWGSGMRGAPDAGGSTAPRMGRSGERAPSARADWRASRAGNPAMNAPGMNSERPATTGGNTAPSRPWPGAAAPTGMEGRAQWRQRNADGAQRGWQQRQPDGARPVVRDRNGDGVSDRGYRAGADRSDNRNRADERRWQNNRNWSNERNRDQRNWDRGWNDNRNGNWNRGYTSHGRLSDRDRWNGVSRWDRDWRRDSRYDWQRYRAANRSFYRMPAYQAPYGWNYGYRRFSIGLFLSDTLFAQNYWINDPGYYRLPPAYGTLRWVRYYDDALLVDMRDGNVVDVIYDFFW